MPSDFKNTPRNFFLLSLLTVVLLTAALPVLSGCRKSEEKKYTVGIVNPNPGDKPITQGFMDAMSKHGYAEGKNLTYLMSESKDTMDADIINMAARNVDLIFTITTPAAKAAQKFTEGSKIPIVFVMYDPVESGVIKSLISHGTNMTGIQIRGSTQKALEWLLVIKPDIKHIYIPVAFDTKAAEQSLEDIKHFISGSNIKLAISEITTVEELKASLSSIPQSVDAIFIPHSILLMSNLNTIVDFANKRKLPVASSGHAQYKEGVLISFGQNLLRTGEQAGRLAHNILTGTPPSELPVEIADFFLGVNLKTARAIGLDMPNEILQAADYIER
ncbi:MAG: ABC transporter substrate-binding protein [Nitrospirota bacterium]|nr:ABC transporter substrate-binding protein [Nitrospirota bacterium]